ncbi:MAG: helix-turn-helix domain-containing protein [Ktedonobacteraceae bacterium]|nr:helix-turn-helix domain-containing protein [Ktedonobacteraceae bacterium]
MKQMRVSQLRYERECRGWSRGYIAEKVEVDVVTVGRWERGEQLPHPHYRQKLRNLFDMSAQELGLLPEVFPEANGQNVMEIDKSPDEITVVTAPENQGEVSNAIAVLPSTAQLPTSTSVKSTSVSSTLLRHRRKLLIGIGGLLGAAAVAKVGSSLLFPASPLVVSKVAPESACLHHFFDVNSSNWVNKLAWSPDGQMIASASDINEIAIWSIEQQLIARYYHTTPDEWVNDVSWSKTNRIASVTANYNHAGTLQVWQFPQDNPLLTLYRPYAIRTVSWSPNDRYLSFASHATVVEIWDPFIPHQVSKYVYPELGLLGINRVKWSPTGNLIACAMDDGTVHVWEPFTVKVKAIYRGHQPRAADLAWSPDERHIVSGGTDKSVHVWDVATGHAVYIYRGHTDEIEGVDWSPRGNYIASASKDLTAQIWEAFTGKLIAKYEGHNSTVETVTWSRDGKTFALGTDKQGIEIWPSPR